MGFIRGSEWWIILAVIILIFGPSKIPGLARALGQSIREYRAGRENPVKDDVDLPKESAKEGGKSEKK
jgi:sec-independent protein translocase protein TatA